MPELPEVETVCRGLRELVLGKTIQQVTVLRPSIIQGEVSAFQQAVYGQKIIRLERRGKYIIFVLEAGAILSHLRMEGKYEYVPEQTVYKKHTHVIFQLDQGMQLRYIDVRAFGRLQYFATLEELQAALTLGPEPWEADPKQVWTQLQRYRSAIKTVLLNQKVISGLGNIYVDEVLFAAQLSPFQPANTLSEAEVIRVINESQRILKAAIQVGGTTVHTYKNAKGESGHYQEQLQVYHKEGQACPRCGSLLEKSKLNGRGTHFCPNCQAQKS